MNPKLKKIAVALLLAGAGIYQYVNQNQEGGNPGHSTQRSSLPPFESSSSVSGDQAIEAAYRRQQSDLQVEAEGRVIKVLADDNKGSRHQKFLIKIPSGLTLLVAHNIDLAPRVKNIQKGDVITFFGEYEWTEKGGVIHWTHHDPGKRHPDGWIRHEGVLYQ